MHAHPVLSTTWRIGVATVGVLVLIAGVIMCVTPGPGAGGIILGLAILATEFAWARGVLRFAQRWFLRAKEHAMERAKRRRRLGRRSARSVW